MRITKKKVIAATAITAVVALGGTAAYAYFTSTGTGSSNATVGTATNWTVTVSAVAGGLLYPGAGTETFSYTIHNASTGSQAFTTVTPAITDDGSGNIVSAGVPIVGCLSTWFVPVINGTPAGTVAGGANYAGLSTGSITMPAANVIQDACQGKAPAFSVAVS